MLLINFPGDVDDEFLLAVGDRLPAGERNFPEMLPPDVPAIVARAARFVIDIPAPARVGSIMETVGKVLTSIFGLIARVVLTFEAEVYKKRRRSFTNKRRAAVTPTSIRSRG